MYNIYLIRRMQKRQEKIQEIGNSIAQAIYVHSHGNMPYEKEKTKEASV